MCVTTFVKMYINTWANITIVMNLYCAVSMVKLHLRWKFLLPDFNKKERLTSRRKLLVRTTVAKES